MATITIQPTNARQAEGNAGTKSFTFTVRRVGDLSASALVDWQVSGAAGLGTLAANADDFDGEILPSGTVSFAPEQTEQIITVAVLSDSTPEFNERFVVSLLSAPPSDVIEVGSAAGTILSDEVSYSIGAIDANHVEGSGGGTNDFTFMVYRGGASLGPKTVDWSVAGLASGGTLAAGAADFAGGVLPSGTVTFAAGETKKLVTVKVAADDSAEMHESFRVTLANPSGNSRIGRASADGTILNDDGSRFSIATSAAPTTEGTGGTTDVIFTVTRTGTGAGTVDWAATGGTRAGTGTADGADFDGGVLPAGTLTFLAGQTKQTITITLAGDDIAELDESFTVTLGNPSGQIGRGSATATITDDEGAIGVIGDNDSAVGTEGDDLFLIGTGNHQIGSLGGADIFAILPDLFDGRGLTASLLDLDVAGGDRIDLTRVDANAATPGIDAFSFIGSAAFSGTAGELRAEDLGGFQLIAGDVNGDSAPDFALFAQLPVADSSFFILT